MANVLLASGRYVDTGSATVLSANQSATLPASNLLDQRPRRVWRSNNLTTIQVSVDLLSARGINFMALIGHNGFTGATFRLRGATSEANLTAAPGYDSTAGQSLWPASGRPSEVSTYVTIFLLASLQTFRYWRLDISDASNPATYFQAGRLILDQYWQPTRNLTYGWQLAFDPADIVEDTPYGTQHATARGRPRKIVLPLDYQSEAQMFDNFYELQRLRGAAQDVVAVYNPADTTYLHKRTVHGLIREVTPITNRLFNIYTARLTIKELI